MKEQKPWTFSSVIQFYNMPEEFPPQEKFFLNKEKVSEKMKDLFHWITVYQIVFKKSNGEVLASLSALIALVITIILPFFVFLAVIIALWCDITIALKKKPDSLV